jgi:hypothetical protein
MRPRALAAFLLCAVLVGPVRAAGLDDVWTGVSWGESPEAIQRHFGSRGYALPQPLDFGDSYAPLVLRDVAVGRLPMIVYFQFDKAGQRLKRIQLELPRHRVNAGAFREIFLALDADYGAPNVSCGTLPGPTTAFQGTAEYVWNREGMVIRAIFRDTTLEAFGGCFSPACGLTAQLLLRISPPTEDSAVCPPLPTRTLLRSPH